MKSELQQSVWELDIQELLSSVDVFPMQFIQASSNTRWLEIRVYTCIQHTENSLYHPLDSGAIG